MNLSGLLHRCKFFIIKNSPKILTTVGIACFAGATVTAIKSSHKIEDRIAEDVDKLHQLKLSLKDKEAINMGTVIEKDTKREMLKTSLHIVGTYLKTYAPSIILFTGGTTCILSANSIMYKRQAALTAAYGALNTSFQKYRERVAQKYGAEEEKALRQGAELIKDKKTGEVSYKQTEDVPVDWSIIYDETCGGWEQGAPLSVQATWLEYIRSRMQDQLETNGYLFLSDVLQELGVNLNHLDERVAQGSRVVGWLFVKGQHEPLISFGLTNPYTNERTQNYYKCVRNDKDCFFLEFNVEGDILTGNEGRKTFIDGYKNR